MIVVGGEALVDLVIDTEGHVVAKLGGGPFNSARAAARLGSPVAFLGSLSRDRFGSSLRQMLLDDGVSDALVQFTELPTTLAAAELDAEEALRQALALHRRSRALHKDLKSAEKELAEDPSDENLARMREIQAEIATLRGNSLTIGAPTHNADISIETAITFANLPTVVLQTGQTINVEAASITNSIDLSGGNFFDIGASYPLRNAIWLGVAFTSVSRSAAVVGSLASPSPRSARSWRSICCVVLLRST